MSSVQDDTKTAAVEETDEKIELENLFDKLPLEMKENIVGWLDTGSKKSLRSVDQDLKNLMDRKFKINATLSDESFETFKSFDPEQQIDKLTVRNFCKPMGLDSRSRSSFAKNVKFLEFISTVGIITGEIHICEACRGFERNMIWLPGTGNSEDNVIKLLRLHPNIERLRFGPMALEHFKITRVSRLFGITLQNLSWLEISFGEENSSADVHDRTMIQPYQQFLKNSFPSLKTFIYRNEACAKPCNLLASIYEFVARQSKSIQSLGIHSHSAYCYDEAPGDMEKMKNAFQKLFGTLEDLQLKELQYELNHFLPVHFNELRTLEEKFVNSLVGLEKVEICWADTHPSILLDFLKNCQTSLTSLTIKMDAVLSEDLNFSCKILSDCKNLRSLTLEVDNEEWSWLSAYRKPSKIEDFEFLPVSIVEFCINGYVHIPKELKLFMRLINLKKFTTYGHFCCDDNKEMFLNVLRYSSITEFYMNRDRCELVASYARGLLNQPIKVIETVTGYLFKIDRKTFTTTYLF